MPERRRQSGLDDRYMVLIRDQVVICDLSKTEAEAIVRAFEAGVPSSILTQWARR